MLSALTRGELPPHAITEEAKQKFDVWFNDQLSRGGAEGNRLSITSNDAHPQEVPTPPPRHDEEMHPALQVGLHTLQMSKGGTEGSERSKTSNDAPPTEIPTPPPTEDEEMHPALQVSEHIYR